MYFEICGNYFVTFFSYLLPFLVICYQIFVTKFLIRTLTLTLTLILILTLTLTLTPTLILKNSIIFTKIFGNKKSKR